MIAVVNAGAATQPPVVTVQLKPPEPFETTRRLWAKRSERIASWLYVPSDQVGVVAKYLGGEAPRIHRLGTNDWVRAKTRVRRAVRDMAGELVRLYSVRMRVPGHAFGPDTPWQAELEEAFPYEETRDQLGAIEGLEFSEDDYYALIRSKTAVLLSAACETGALCGASHYRSALRQYGELLGMAFQIADDILDYTSDSTVTGKPSGLDLREHKVTLPLILARPQLSAKSRARVEELFATEDPDDQLISDVVAVVAEAGGIERAHQRGERFAQEAEEARSHVPSSIRTRPIARNPFLRLGFDLGRKVREDRPDLLHVQYTAPLSCPVPVVVTVHDRTRVSGRAGYRSSRPPAGHECPAVQPCSKRANHRRPLLGVPGTHPASPPKEA